MQDPTISDGDLTRLALRASLLDRDGVVTMWVRSESGLAVATLMTRVDISTVALLASECITHRKLIDAARCRITALEEAGFHEIAHFVRESAKKVPL